MGMGSSAAGAAGGASLWPLVIAQLGSSALGALTVPEGQELQSFEGDPVLDPRRSLSETRTQFNDLLSTLKTRANQPINLRSAYAQPLPVFTGGGLPMPIGVTGIDPALSDPSLLSLPSLDFPDTPGRERRTGPDGGVSSFDGYVPSPDATVHEGRFAVPRLDSGGGERNTTMPARRNAASAPSRGAANVSTHDDLPQAAGAVELLLRSYMA